jgi:uncharacterized protein (TIGR02246 family)
MTAMSITLAATLVAAACLNPALGQTPGDPEAAVRGLVARYIEAREKRDAAAIEALFAPDADQLVSSGEWRRGRDAVVRGTLASSQANGGQRSITVESVRFLSPDIALADGRYELTGLQGGGADTRRMWTTIVCRKTAAGWRIAAIRNMLPSPGR